MRLLVSLLVWALRAVLTSRRSLVLENLALRQQLAASARTQKRPRLKPIRSAYRAAGAIGVAPAGGITTTRLRIPGPPSGFRGARYPTRKN